MVKTGDGDPSTLQSPLTLSDIARLAGVSVPTVSKVVNSRAEVSADTRANVEKACTTTDTGATNWFGGLTATRPLLDLGHRRVAVITGPPWALNSRARLDGYRTALETAGIPADDDLIRGGAFEIANGAAETTELLAMAEPPTAIFALNDGIAIGVYHAASLAGVRIPDDLSVVGFDNYALDEWLVPALTTVHQPLEEMGAAAARMVVDLALDATPPQTNRIELATKLINRASTAAPLPH